MNRYVAALAASLLFGGAAMAQTAGSTLTLTLDGLKSGNGKVMATLCGNPKAQFPGGCGDYRATVQARAGQTVVTFAGVKPGDYAIQAFHDENGDGVPQIPAEGFAFGNNAGMQATFATASIKVDGDTRTSARMTYGVPGQGGSPLYGGKGAPAPEGVERIDLREQGLYGELYRPKGVSGRLPVVIVLGGSDGGLNSSGMAVSFANKGYAALALAYWAEEGLPKTLEEVPLEYFDRAVAWLKARPDIDPKGIGVIGWSYGSNAALLLGSRNKDVHAVAAVAPSGIVWRGFDPADQTNAKPAKSLWTANGKPLAYVMPVSSAYRTGVYDVFFAGLPEANRRPETAIPVERTNGPVLLISGSDDRLWPAAQMADRIVARLQGARFPHSVEHLTYAGAGHAIFVGEPDGIMARGFLTPNPTLGGTPAANRKAWEDNWPKTIAFFDKALKRSSK